MFRWIVAQLSIRKQLQMLISSQSYSKICRIEIARPHKVIAVDEIDCMPVTVRITIVVNGALSLTIWLPVYLSLTPA